LGLEEISLSKDANDFKDASDAVKHIFTSNLLRQTALDSIQGRGAYRRCPLLVYLN